MSTLSWPGYGRLMEFLGRVADPDPIPLLVRFEEIITSDNRRGVLEGTDRDGIPMPAVRYRPIGEKPKRVTKRQQNSAGVRGVFAGLGPHAAGLNNNLAPAEYRRLGGPPLAPRGANSRVITNLVTEHTAAPDSQGEWFAVGYWDEVVSAEGKPFLHAHFEGLATGGWYKGSLPRRDLRGVRPQGLREAFAAMREWVRRDLLAGL